MNGSYPIYECVMAQIRISHGTHMVHGTHVNESSHIYELVMSHMGKSHVTHVNESCHTHE